jgi:hypothetical protein
MSVSKDSLQLLALAVSKKMMLKVDPVDKETQARS